MAKKGGFTLMELLTVIVVISVLAGLLLPALGQARRRARVASAQAAISSIQTAASMYNLDWGVYPISATSAGTQRNMNAHVAQNLVFVLTRATRGGPYMEFKGADLLDGGGSADQRYAAADPWGRAYVYMSRTYRTAGGDWEKVANDRGPFHPHTDAPEHNTFNIYSLGPDGMTDMFASPVTDWNHANLLNNEDAGDWKAAADSDAANYDDINSWDGARR